MTNSIAAESFPGLIEDNNNTFVEQGVESVQPKVHVDTSQSSNPPELSELVNIYAAQNRECWLCEGVAKKIADGKEISEDDSWHFTSCVLSWEYINKNR